MEPVDPPRWRRHLWALLGVVTCIAMIGGSAFALVVERREVPAISLWDYGFESGMRVPIAPDAQTFGGEEWVLHDRMVADSMGWIDIMGCRGAIEYAALAGVPIVRDSYESAGAKNGFIYVSHVDYGSDDVADRRLAPIRNPRSACDPRSLASQPSEVIRLPEYDAVVVTGRRTGEWLTITVSDDVGRAVLITGARADDEEIGTLVDRSVRHLGGLSERGPVATTVPD